MFITSLLKIGAGAVWRKVLIYGSLTAIVGGSGYYFYNKINTAFDKANKYDLAIVERDAAFVERDRARQKLLDQVAEHAVEIARQQQSRDELAADRSAILKAAQIEGGKYRKLKNDLKQVKNWANGVVPDVINRLLRGEDPTPNGATGLRDIQDIPESSK